MTTTAPDNSVDPTADQQTRPADELEDWLTDIRVNLSDDPPGWLTPEDDVTEPDDAPTVEPPTARHHVPDGATPTRSERPNGEPVVGRHRAAD